jgi:hypothetical protein
MVFKILVDGVPANLSFITADSKRKVIAQVGKGKAKRTYKLTGSNVFTLNTETQRWQIVILDITTDIPSDPEDCYIVQFVSLLFPDKNHKSFGLETLFIMLCKEWISFAVHPPQWLPVGSSYTYTRDNTFKIQTEKGNISYKFPKTTADVTDFDLVSFFEERNRIRELPYRVNKRGWVAIQVKDTDQIKWNHVRNIFKHAHEGNKEICITKKDNVNITVSSFTEEEEICKSCKAKWNSLWIGGKFRADYEPDLLNYWARITPNAPHLCGGGGLEPTPSFSPFFRGTIEGTQNYVYNTFLTF